jgi:hypothetical protein
MSDKEVIENVYARIINYENNTKLSIEKFKALNEIKLREKFIKWNIVGENNENNEKNNNTNNNTNTSWFF